MSFVATVMARMWFIHKCTITLLVPGDPDDDNQVTYTWGDPVAVPSSRLRDLTMAEIISAVESGVLNVTNLLLVPLTVTVTVGTKVTDVRTNGVGWLAGPADVLVDAGPYEVRSIETARSQTDEYRQCLLRKIG